MSGLELALARLNPPAEVRAAFKADLRRATDVSRKAGVDRRTVTRRLHGAGLPTVKHWLRLARILRAHDRLREGGSLKVLVTSGLYPDPFSFSGQINRELGVRSRAFREMSAEDVIDLWRARRCV